MKLSSLGRARQCRGRGSPARNNLSNLVEIPGADEALVRDGAVAKFLGCELFLLEFRVGGHASLRVAARKMEHRHVQRVKTGERHKLKLVAHLPEFLLEVGDGDIVEFFLPIERRRTVVGQQFPREFRMNSLGKLLCFRKIGRRSFAPNYVRVRSVSQAAGNRRVNAAAEVVEAFGSALTVNKFA